MLGRRVNVRFVAQVRAVFGEDPRKYSVMTTKFLGDDDGNVKGLITIDVEVGPDGIKVTPWDIQCGDDTVPCFL